MVRKRFFFWLVLTMLISNSVFSQTEEEQLYNHFISIFKVELKKYNIGKIEKNYKEKYFVTKAESEYLDKNVTVGLTTLFQKCYNKDDDFIKEEIKAYFQQLKLLKNERESLNKDLLDFSSIKQKLKVRLYPESFRDTYKKAGAVIRDNNLGIIEVIVMDLETGIGSLEEKYIKQWEISTDFVYNIAKENTIKQINARFEQFQPTPSGTELNLLADDYDLFVTSCILDLDKFNIPQGKYGIIVSVPNNTMVIASALEDKNTVEIRVSDLMGVTNYMFGLNEVKPLSNNLFWYDGKKIRVIKKDLSNEKFIYPEELKELMN